MLRYMKSSLRRKIKEVFTNGSLRVGRAGGSTGLLPLFACVFYVTMMRIFTNIELHSPTDEYFWNLAIKRNVSNRMKGRYESTQYRYK